MHHITAILAAGGTGSRMRAGMSKQYLDLSGKPVLARTLEVFQECRLVSDIIVVTSPENMDRCRSTIVEPMRLSKVARIVEGGDSRQESVGNGLREIPDAAEYVVVHDGARPLLTSGVLEEVIEEAISMGAAVTAVPCKDTVKVSDADGFVTATLDRGTLWSVQTPQAFEKGLLLNAYAYAAAHSISATDDAMLVEKLGHPVRIVPGEYSNIKITTPEDMDAAAAILKRRLKA